MGIAEWVYKIRGINPSIKKTYISLFNSSNTRARGTKVIEDLIIHFRFYGAKPTTDPIALARQAGHREVIEYILTMAARVSDSTLSDIEQFINKGGNDE